MRVAENPIVRALAEDHRGWILPISVKVQNSLVVSAEYLFDQSRLLPCDVRKPGHFFEQAVIVRGC